jgi:hypothetical protein
MAGPLLDNEFLQYWSKLSVVEKESLLTVARNYVQAKHDDESDPNDLRKKIIQQERENYLQGKGQSYSWEQVKAMALDKSNRHAL